MWLLVGLFVGAAVGWIGCALMRGAKDATLAVCECGRVVDV